MKKVFSVFFTLFSFLCSAQTGYEVTIDLKGIGDNSIRIFSQRNGKYVLDTISQNPDKKFVWFGYTEDPQYARIEVLDTTKYLRVGRAVSLPPAFMFMLKNCKIKISGNAADVYLANLETSDVEVKAYDQFRLSDIQDQMETWSLQQQQHKKYVDKDTTGMAELARKMQVLRRKNQHARAVFIENNPDRYASLLMLQSLFLVMSNSELQSKFNSLNESIRNSKTGLMILSKIESNSNTAVGKPVIPIAQPDMNGNAFDISSLKGKVILIDFWGSWCVPCRKSHPELKKLYEKYKSKGFEIVGVSNELAVRKDMSEQDIAWRKAIKEDGIDWIHILYDPAISDIVKSYDINGYPTKFLIDQNGKFILRLLGTGDSNKTALEKKLAELMPD